MLFDDTFDSGIKLTKLTCWHGNLAEFFCFMSVDANNSVSAHSGPVFLCLSCIFYFCVLCFSVFLTKCVLVCQFFVTNCV